MVSAKTLCFRLSERRIHLFETNICGVRIVCPDRYCYHDNLMNALNSIDKTDKEYSPAITDELVRFWRSEVKVTAGL